MLLPFAWRGLRAHLGRIPSPGFAMLVLTGTVLAVIPFCAPAGHIGAGNIALLVCATPAFVLMARRLPFCLGFPAALGAWPASPPWCRTATRGRC